jgi:hypothetical protein
MMLPCTFHEKTDRETFWAGSWGIIARASGLQRADGLKRGPMRKRIRHLAVFFWLWSFEPAPEQQ